MVEDPEQTTIADVFRAVNDMRVDTFRAIDDLRQEMQAEFRAVRQELADGFKAAAEERGAIRKVIDDQLAGQKQVDAHEKRIIKLEKAR